jgi:hypothetical protein
MCGDYVVFIDKDINGKKLKVGQTVKIINDEDRSAYSLVGKTGTISGIAKGEAVNVNFGKQIRSGHNAYGTAPEGQGWNFFNPPEQLEVIAAPVKSARKEKVAA